MPAKGYRKDYFGIEPPGQRYCAYHKSLHPIEDFPANQKSWCKEAWREYRRNERAAGGMSRSQQRRLQVLRGYGCKCARCGTTDPLVLQLDHVDENLARAQERQFGKIGPRHYIDAIARGYPKDYQLLCGSCNMRKRQLRAGKDKFYRDAGLLVDKM